MKIRVFITLLLIASVPMTVHAAKKKKPLAVEVSAATDGVPLVTLTASDAPLHEVAKRLSEKLGTPIDVSPGARAFRVTTELDKQPLDLALRELAPQAYVDGILSGGAGKLVVLSIHLRSAGEAAPALAELAKRTSEAIMFFGHTEDPAGNPFEGKLDVTYRDGRLTVFARQQPLSVVAALIADAIGIPLQLVGDPRAIVDVSLADGTVEQAVMALPSSVKLYHRKDLTTFRTTPVRLVVEEPFEGPVTDPATTDKPAALGTDLKSGN